MDSPIRPGTPRTGTPPPRPGAPCVRCATVNRPGAQFCDRCGGRLGSVASVTEAQLTASDGGNVHRPTTAIAPPPPYAAAPVTRTTFVPYPVPVRDDRREGSSFGTGFGLSLGWIAGRLLFQLLMLAIFFFVGIALVGPVLSALRIW
jgi:hypothetical protein